MPLGDLFRDYDGPTLLVRLWNGWEWKSVPRQSAHIILTIKSPGALAALAPWSPETVLCESFLRRDIDASGDVFSVLTLLEYLLNRQQSPLRRLTHFIGGSMSSGGKARGDSDASDCTLITHRSCGNADLYRALLGDPLRHPHSWCQGGMDESALAKKRKFAGAYELSPTRSLEYFAGTNYMWYSPTPRASSRHRTPSYGIVFPRAHAKVVRDLIAESLDVEDWRIEPCICGNSIQRSGSFDGIASLGVLEHMGRQSLLRYMRSAGSLLKSGGSLLCHSIVIASPIVAGDRSNRLASLPSFIDIVESVGFEVRELERLCLDEESQVYEWLEHLRDHRNTLPARLSEVTHRTWLLYLAAFGALLRHEEAAIHQILLRRKE